MLLELDRITTKPHLIPWGEGWELFCTYEQFEQRTLALEQLFLQVHTESLNHSYSDYRPAAYKPFWDRCKTRLACWMPGASNDDCYLKYLTEGAYVARDGAGCFAVLCFDVYEHEYDLVTSLGKQGWLFA